MMLPHTSPRPNLDKNLIAAAKSVVLLEIEEALNLCLKGHRDPIYPGQTEPLSVHLRRLKKALETDNIETIKAYRRAEGSWFPYHNIVELFFEALESEGLL